MNYLLRRAAYGVFLLAGVSILAFCSLELAPGDYFDTLRTNPRISTETIQSLRERSGVNRPLSVRYWRWLISILHGNWGYSLTYGEPAMKIIKPRAVNTLLLTGFSTFTAWIIALAIGVFSATWQGRLPDWIFRLGMAVALATPDVVLALLFLLALVRFGKLPSGFLDVPGDVAADSATRSVAANLLMPGLCLVLSLAPVLIAHVRAAVGEVLRKPFIRAARGHGIPPVRLLLRHVLPVAANPLISLLGLSIGALLNTSLIVEVLFNWPGLGQLLLESIQNRDVYIVVDIVMLSSVFLLFGNFLADILLLWCDPRIESA